MSADWILEELGTIVTGKTPPQALEKAYSVLGTPFLTPKDMDGRKWITSTERYLSEAGVSSVKNSLIPAGSISVSCIGSDMGKAVMVPVDTVTNQQINSIIPDKTKCHPEYLYYLLSTKQQELKDIAGGSATPILNKGHFGKVQVHLPDIGYQAAAAKILSGFDDKIQLNHQINQTLEQIAQAIFKSWFVDFEPVKAKMAALEAGGSEDDALLAAMQAIAGNALFASNAADADAATQLARLQTEHPEQYASLRATAELFPAAMQDSELGEIPEGWEVKSVESQFQITIGRTPPRKEPEWFSENPEHVKWLSIKKMGEGNVFANDSDEYLTQEAVDKFKIKICPEGTVLLSFKLTLGRVMIAKKDMTTNEAIAHFRISAHSPGSYWTYLYLNQFDYSTLGSTSSIATAVNSKIIKQMPLITSDATLLKYFETSVTPIFESIYNRQLQNESLGSLRDSLLPKLLSGELSINKEID